MEDKNTGGICSSPSYYRANTKKCQCRECAECKRAYWRKWKANNKEKVRQWGKKYRAENKDKIRVKTKQWAATHKEQRNKTSADYRARHPEKIKAIYRRDLDASRAKARQYNWNRRLRTIALLGDKCVRCGFSDCRALQIDHIDGGGTQHKESIGQSPSKIIHEIKKAPHLYQLLCANCNWIKRYENDELRKGRRWHRGNMLSKEGSK